MEGEEWACLDEFLDLLLIDGIRGNGQDGTAKRLQGILPNVLVKAMLLGTYHNRYKNSGISLQEIDRIHRKFSSILSLFSTSFICQIW